LAEVLRERVPGLSGPADAMQALAQAWRAVGGQAAVVSRRKLFRLAELRPPQPPAAGRPRMAGPADRALLAEWLATFAVEVGDVMPDPARVVDRRLENGGLLLWEVDGVPVSLAGITRPVAGVARVAPVYTPAALRGRGYAAAVTAEISRRALEEGLAVVLFTDVANPTSNALYQRLGYRPVGGWTALELT
jgi:predicted GNAT family acetyltransferase